MELRRAVMATIKRREVKLPSNLKNKGKNFITLEESRKRRTPKPKR